MSILYKQINRTISHLTNWLLPQSCFLCGLPCTKPLCDPCLKDLPYLHETKVSKATFRRLLNIGCTDIHAIFRYDYPVGELIQAAKFNQNFAILHFLGNIMGQKLAEQFANHRAIPKVMIPVPLHPRRLRERGYNQSLELAKEIVKQIPIPLNYTVCTRIRDTPHQVGLPLAQRYKNLKEAFAVQNLPSHWQHVVVIDDVMTTGSTIAEVTAVLHRAGVARVDAWCCARTSIDVNSKNTLQNW